MRCGGWRWAELAGDAREARHRCSAKLPGKLERARRSSGQALELFLSTHQPLKQHNTMVSNPFTHNSTAGAEPTDAPPAYSQATSQAPATGGNSHAGHRHTQSLEVPGGGLGRRDSISSDYTNSDEGHDHITEEDRINMAADERPLPEGWSREYDAA